MRLASTTKQLFNPFARFMAPALAGIVIACIPVFTAPAYAQLTIKAYISPPNTQSAPASVTGKTTETFALLSSGTSPATKQTYTSYSSSIGAYSGGTFASVKDDNYGTGTGNYFSLGAQSGTSDPVTLTFATPVQYFGLSYNAGDVNNGFTFYDESNKLIGRYSTEKLINTLKNAPNGKVTAINNTQYSSAEYYGKPDGDGPGTANTGLNTGEPYAFLSFFVEGGTAGSKGVKKVVFDNSGSTGTGFESDNHTISTIAQLSTARDTMVLVGTTDTPEASTFALLAAGSPILAGGIALRTRRGRREVRKSAAVVTA